ncbi:hypothetical protein JZ751_026044, partial [Albula glossodonta]
VESRDTLNSIALKFDTTPNELVQLNKLFSRAVVPGQNSDGISRPPAEAQGPARTVLRSARVVSSTSEEEEALTEKFLKINCKYITDGKGAVSGVLLVTPNNIMFDPHRTDPLVQEHGCEEYGIMCPLEEVMSAAMYTEITDSKIRESVPPDLEQPSSGQDVFQQKRILNTDEAEPRNDSGSAVLHNMEESLSEDVFTEPELSPIREELVSPEEPRHDKSSGASCESVQTISQAEPESQHNGREEQGEAGSLEGQSTQPSRAGSKQHSRERASSSSTSRDQGEGTKSRFASESQGLALTPGGSKASGQVGPEKENLNRQATGESETE